MTRNNSNLFRVFRVSWWIVCLNLVFLATLVAGKKLPDLMPVVFVQKRFPMKFAVSNAKSRGCLRVLVMLSVYLMANEAYGQSADIATPSPIRSNQVIGTISARDIGDPRLTDHYYAFVGTPGDVLITVDSRNLNGDIDVFTSTGLRPLLKFTVYSNNSGPITKSIYLRKREELILRVEARTPNDDEGTYRLSFSGSFEPHAGDPLVAENQPAPLEEVSGTPAKKGRRVSSVGARIDEPPAPEVAAAPTPEPTPATMTSQPTEPVATTPAETSESEKMVTPPTTPRNPRGRRGSARRTRTPPPPKVEEPVANAEPAAQPSGEVRSAPPTTGRGSTRRGGTARRVVEEAPVEESGPRLIIETNDGTLINRYMSSVRRVTVENGQVLVVSKDGKTERIPLANVLRMSIAP